tara:strand:- start:6126 stop:6662 length:537 start_codon:yes stop_codon:yes gene_type:complete
MTIKDYNFVRDSPEIMEHLARHLDGSTTQGSHFMQEAFPNARALIDYALQHIQDYQGKKTVKEVDAGRNIGYDSLVSLENLPENTSITEQPRGRDGYLVNIVESVKKQPTSNIVIVAGPIDEERHGFYTIYPGQNAPPFPVTKEKLKEMGYEGEELQRQVEVNKTYAEFWDTHGFVGE